MICYQVVKVRRPNYRPRKMFIIFRKYNTKLKLTKCAYGVTSGKIFGFMVTSWRIEANHNKIATTINMKEPKTCVTSSCVKSRLLH